MSAVPTTARRRGRTALVAMAVPLLAVAVGASTTTRAEANTGFDCTANQYTAVYSQVSTSSSKVGALHTGDGWHHYYSEYSSSGGRWSSGYIIGSSAWPGGTVRGYVPYGLITC